MPWFAAAAVRRYRLDGGQMVGGPSKIVLHTTETKGVPRYGDPAGLNSAPHFTVDRDGAVYQHQPINRASRSLRNLKGGVQTNRQGMFCVQIEIVGYARDGSNLPAAQLSALRSLVAWIMAETGIDPVWRDIDRGSHCYGANSPCRMTPRQWVEFEGVCGHQEVPENCVSADTPILCADLTWRPAGDLLPGDELIALDEENTERWGRRFRKATVVNNAVVRDALLLVTTERGSVRCNYGHPWLTQRGWVRAAELTPDDKVWWFVDPWTTDRSWEAGWLAGMYDGDGCLSITKNRTSMLVLTQRESETAERGISEIKARAEGVAVVRRSFGSVRSDMVQVQITSRWESMRVLGSVRPPRLLVEAERMWLEGSANRNRKLVSVTEVRPYGTGMIASLETSTSTYIAAGFAMHNTHWDPGNFDMSTLFVEEEQVMRRGDRGNAVRKLQWALKAWNPDALPTAGADGDYGPETEEWVRRYQTAAELTPTGVADGVTVAFLLEYVADATAAAVAAGAHDHPQYAPAGHGHTFTVAATPDA